MALGGMHLASLIKGLKNNQLKIALPCECWDFIQ